MSSRREECLLSGAAPWLGATLAFVVALSGAPGAARAQQEAQRTGAARALYDQAVMEMERGSYESACPKLEASVKLEPDAIGARFTLAACYEGAGKLASAWSAYLQVEGVASRARQTARQTRARERAEALRPRLAQLIIVVPEEVQALPGLTISHDGLEIEPALYRVPLPVDKGTHRIVVTATEKKKVEQNFEVDRDGQSVTLNIPRLRPEQPAPSPTLPLPPPVLVPEAAERPPIERALPRLHIDSDDPYAHLTLYRVDGELSATGGAIGYGPAGPTFAAVTVGGVARSSVCTAPCDSEIDGSSGAEFFLGGEGITDSSRFRLQGMVGPVVLKASPGSRAVRAGGIVSTVIGASGLLFGAISLGISTARESPSGVRTLGGVSVGIGAVMTILGIPLIRAGRTTFDFKDGSVQF